MKEEAEDLIDTQEYREEIKQENEEEEVKHSIEIKHKSHRQKTSPQYLFQAETESSKLHVFCIQKKELQVHELDFIFPKGMGFYHIENGFYLGGGVAGDFPNYQFYS